MMFGWPDLVVIALVLWGAFSAVRRGFVSVLLSLAGFIVALIAAFTFYPPVALWLSERFGWSPVWCQPLAFVGVWVLVELAFALLDRFLHGRYGSGLRESQVNRALGVVPGGLQGTITAAVLMTLLALLPLQNDLRRDILASPTAGRLVTTTIALERPFEGIFGPAAREALGFITVRTPTQPGTVPSGGEDGGGHSESIQLQFNVAGAPPSPSDETEMLALVNRERTSRGLRELEMDEPLRQVARAHAADMFARGYFAHETPEGVDPFQRMQQAGIIFGYAGENLALAPTLDMAHEGLMNSPGHRANILQENFGKAGIGVLDGGVYGKMFVQEFTD